ncbi:MAG: hypothetical protein SFV53_00265 [Rickettsiales bacterium]|nr:hypothetical protein [Rickettsiales bacterium]
MKQNAVYQNLIEKSAQDILEIINKAIEGQTWNIEEILATLQNHEEQTKDLIMIKVAELQLKDIEELTGGQFDNLTKNIDEQKVENVNFFSEMLYEKYDKNILQFLELNNSRNEEGQDSFLLGVIKNQAEIIKAQKEFESQKAESQNTPDTKEVLPIRTDNPMTNYDIDSVYGGSTLTDTTGKTDNEDGNSYASNITIRTMQDPKTKPNISPKLKKVISKISKSIVKLNQKPNVILNLKTKRSIDKALITLTQKEKMDILDYSIWNEVAYKDLIPTKENLTYIWSGITYAQQELMRQITSEMSEEEKLEFLKQKISSMTPENFDSFHEGSDVIIKAFENSDVIIEVSENSEFGFDPASVEFYRLAMKVALTELNSRKSSTNMALERRPRDPIYDTVSGYYYGGEPVSAILSRSMRASKQSGAKKSSLEDKASELLTLLNDRENKEEEVKEFLKELANEKDDFFGYIFSSDKFSQENIQLLLEINEEINDFGEEIEDYLDYLDESEKPSPSVEKPSVLEQIKKEEKSEKR